MSMRMTLVLPVLALAMALTGCIARTAAKVVTLPVKAVGAGVDAATTSQEEADRNRGRANRKQEERDAKERKRLLKRSEERRVGKEWDSTCRSRWSPET